MRVPYNFNKILQSGNNDKKSRNKKKERGKSSVMEVFSLSLNETSCFLECALPELHALYLSSIDGKPCHHLVPYLNLSYHFLLASRRRNSPYFGPFEMFERGLQQAY